MASKKNIANETVEPEEESHDEEENNDETESENEDEDEQEVTVKQKNDKKKESHDDMISKIDNLKALIKEIDKEISDFNKDITELNKKIKSKDKIKNDYEKQINNILKVLGKTHADEIKKVRKEKNKRKGNVNGGFNKESPVPEVLCDFLNLPNDTLMSRPKVMSALNNKFTELNIKFGQNTILNKDVVAQLKLSDDFIDKPIKFTEFQGFLASFYPKKKVDVEVEIVV